MSIIYSPFAKVFKIAEFANVFQHSYCVYANTCALNHSHAQCILIFIPLYFIAYYYNILYFILLYHCIIRVNFIVEIYMLCILLYTYNINNFSYQCLHPSLLRHHLKYHHFLLQRIQLLQCLFGDQLS